MHSIKPEHHTPQGDVMGVAGDVRYVLASCDYRNMEPVLLDES